MAPVGINIIFGNYGEWTRTAIKLVTKLIINEIILVEQFEYFVHGTRLSKPLCGTRDCSLSSGQKIQIAV